MDNRQTFRFKVVASRRVRDENGRWKLLPEHWETVDITITWEWLVTQVGKAAVFNQSGKASVLAGAVTAKHLRSTPKMKGKGKGK